MYSSEESDSPGITLDSALTKIRHEVNGSDVSINTKSQRIFNLV